MFIRALDHVSLTMPVGSEGRARVFYAGVLGLVEIPKPDDGNRMDGCWFDLGSGQQLHMLIDEGFAPATRAHPAFCAPDLGALRQRLIFNGASIADFLPSDGRERFFCTDPFGNRLEFLEERGA